MRVGNAGGICSRVWGCSIMFAPSWNHLSEGMP